MDNGTLNLCWAQALVDGLAAAGIEHAVISPGSRATPLALAFLRQPAIHTWIVIDERSAAFFALGLTKAGGQPAALLCTSGSAPANWFPAVIEADADAVPLLLLSADRPPESRGWGANQTIDQLKLFGDHVRAAHALGTPDAGFNPAYLHHLAARAVGESRWPLPGPVHLNLPFREPMVPGGDLPPATRLAPLRVAAPQLQPAPTAIAELSAAIAGRPGLIVCGGGDYTPAFPAAVTELAERLDCPVLAEPLTNLRFGSHDRSRICARAEAFLRAPGFAAGQRAQWLLRFGAYPISRAVGNWLATANAATHIVVDPHGRWPDPLHASTMLLQADPQATCTALAAAAPAPGPADWRAAFVTAEARAKALAAELRSDAAIFEDTLLPALLSLLPPGHRLFCGNSMVVRDFDTFSGSADKALRLFGNRGVSGIDGNISTAAGIAAKAGPTVAVVGDLTCTHDLTGLAAARGLDLVVVVVNNGGGGIFSYLPEGALADFERAWLAPPDVDFSHAAATWGIAHHRVEHLSTFAAGLAAAIAAGGPHLIEVVVDRARSVLRHRAYWAAIGQ